MSTPRKPAGSTPAKTAPPPEPQWLRAQRAGITEQADLTEFSAELERLTTSLTDRPGRTVPAALVWTVAGIVIAGVVMLIGFGLFSMGTGIWGSLNG